MPSPLDFQDIVEFVERRTSSQGVGSRTFESTTGYGDIPDTDSFKMMLIQVSAVTTVASGTVPVVPAYDWTEVIRVNGAYTTLGDGRSGTAATFPAFDSNMSPTVTLNNGSTTSAYLAWLSWDQQSLEFVTPVSSAAPAISFSGAKVYTNAIVAVGGVISWPAEVFDTDAYHDPALPTNLTAPTTAYYEIGYALTMISGGGAATQFSNIRAIGSTPDGGFDMGATIWVPSSLGDFIILNSKTIAHLAAGWNCTVNVSVNDGGGGGPGTFSLFGSYFWITRLGT